MTPFECYRTYLALKRHFTSDYDYFKYHGKTNASFNAFEARNDKLFFMKVAKHPDPLHFMMINILHNPKVWIRDIAYGKDAEDLYQGWLKKIQALTYFFVNDLKKLSNFKDAFIFKANEHPPIITKYLSGEIALETLVIITTVVETGDVLAYWDKKMENDPVWEDISTKIKKYTPFLSLDRGKLKAFIVQALRDGDK
jgi:hypothetical protein